MEQWLPDTGDKKENVREAGLGVSWRQIILFKCLFWKLTHHYGLTEHSTNAWCLPNSTHLFSFSSLSLHLTSEQIRTRKEVVCQKEEPLSNNQEENRCHCCPERRRGNLNHVLLYFRKQTTPCEGRGGSQGTLKSVALQVKWSHRFDIPMWVKNAILFPSIH